MVDFTEHLAERLRQSQEDGQLLAIHEMADDPELFIVGTIHGIGKEFVSVCTVDPHGHDDGIAIVRLANVKRLHWASEYVARVGYLVEQALESSRSSIRASFPTADPSLPTALAFALENNFVVTVHGNDKITGLVRKVGEGWAEIEVFTDLGAPDGIFLVSTDEIERLDIDGYDERRDLSVQQARPRS